LFKKRSKFSEPILEHMLQYRY